MLKHCVDTMFGNKGEGLLQACISSFYSIACAIFAQRQQISQLLRSVKSINDCGRVAMVRRSRCMGGHLTDLMTVRSGTGKDLKKNM